MLYPFAGQNSFWFRLRQVFLRFPESAQKGKASPNTTSELHGIPCAEWQSDWE